MKVINETVWRTDQLRAILQLAAERELEPAKRKRLVVRVCYTRGGHSSGCAWVGGRHATVRIKHPESRARTWQGQDQAAAVAETVVRFASVAVHEFAHIRGMHHDTMPANYKWHGRWRDYVAWAVGMPLEPKPAKVKAKPTVDDKLAHVLRMKRLAETRLKRAQTILRKWRQRERYYLKAAQRPDTKGAE